jgi:8-hydroxy-5-deazaflavin:NADPH oxidoreductase
VSQYPGGVAQGPLPTVGVLGGTGPQGNGLALRWAAAGLPVVIGSRDAGRAITAAGELAQRAGLGADVITGTDNAGCAARADIVLVAVPWDGHDTLLAALREPLAGKIIVD